MPLLEGGPPIGRLRGQPACHLSFRNPCLVRILAIETSLRFGSVATIEGSDQGTKLIHQEDLPTDQRTAQSLLPSIGQVLQHSRWRPTDLQLLAVATGPGSFTGLRIGVTTVKSLAFAWGTPLAAVNTLGAIAASLSPQPSSCSVILDAQRQELFTARVSPASGGDFLGNPATRLLSVEEWLAELNPGDTVAGPPLAKIRERLPCDVIVADESLWFPQAQFVGQLGYALFQAGNTTDPLQLTPQYFRKSAAEEKAAQRDGTN